MMSSTTLTAEALPPTDHLVAQAEAQHVVAKAVTALPEPYRTTVLLRYFESLSLSEVAKRMGSPVKTVQTRLTRAHALLRAALDREFGDRRAWCVALLPLAHMRFPVPSGAVATGIPARVRFPEHRGEDPYDALFAEPALFI